MMITMATQIVSQRIPIWFWIVPIRWSIIHFSVLLTLMHLFSKYLTIYCSLWNIQKKILIERRFLGSLEVLLIAQLGWKLFEDLMRTSRLLRKNLFLNFLILRTPCCIFFALWNWEQRRFKRLFMMHKKQLLGATTGNVMKMFFTDFFNKL